MDKKKILEQAISKLKKKKGFEKVNLSFGDVNPPLIIPTPFPPLNNLLGEGIPRGKYGTIAGASQVAKTTLCLQIIAHNQKIDSDFYALWSDAEDAWDAAWAEELGCDLNRIVVHKYDDTGCPNAETLMQIGLDLVETHIIDIWVVDSIGGLLPKAEDNKDLEEATMSETARLMGKFYRKATKVIAPTDDFDGTACVLIGQIYSVINTRFAGLNEVRGGNAVKHWASWRLMARRGSTTEIAMENVMQPDGVVKKLKPLWNQHLRLEKTKLNEREGQEIILQFILGKGLDSVQSLIATLFAYNIFERKGGWYYHELFPDGKLQGRPAIEDLLREDEQLRKACVAELNKKSKKEKENED
jgi:protein RecA